MNIMSSIGSVKMVDLNMIVDNSIPLPKNRCSTVEYGLSFFIHAKGEEEIYRLFDNGSTDKVLSENFDVLGIDVRDVDYVVLSHRHYDHTGGFKKLLELRGKSILVLAHPNLFKPTLTTTSKLRSIGILHLLYSSRNRISNTASFISTQNVKAAMPLHCTETIAEARFQDEIPNVYHMGSWS